MTEMYFCLLRMGISEESIWKLRSLPYAIWFLWNLSRIFNGMPHCSIIPLIRARENGSATACVNLWLKTLRLSLSRRYPHPFFQPSLALYSSFTSSRLPCCLFSLRLVFSRSGYPSLSLFTSSFFSLHSRPLSFTLFLPFVSHSNTLAYMCLFAVPLPPKRLYTHCDRLSAPLEECI